MVQFFGVWLYSHIDKDLDIRIGNFVRLEAKGFNCMQCLVVKPFCLSIDNFLTECMMITRPIVVLPVRSILLHFVMSRCFAIIAIGVRNISDRAIDRFEKNYVNFVMRTWY